MMFSAEINLFSAVIFKVSCVLFYTKTSDKMAWIVHNRYLMICFALV